MKYFMKPMRTARTKRLFEALTLFKLSKGERIVDVGAGDGIVSMHIGERFHCDITCIDKGQDINGRYKRALFISSIHHMKLEEQLRRLNEALCKCKEVIIFDVEPTLLVIFNEKLQNHMGGDSPAPSTFRYVSEIKKMCDILGAKIICSYSANGFSYGHRYYGLRIMKEATKNEK